MWTNFFFSNLNLLVVLPFFFGVCFFFLFNLEFFRNVRILITYLSVLFIFVVFLFFILLYLYFDSNHLLFFGDNLQSSFFSGFTLNFIEDVKYTTKSCSVMLSLFEFNFLSFLHLDLNSYYFFFDKYDIQCNFFFDPLTIVMCFVIILITFFVNLYSLNYMFGDKMFLEFFMYLIFFMSFMLLLVCSSNLVQLFIGWEGVGVTSYLLIRFWFGREKANFSGLKALVMNRFGDISLLIAFCLIFKFFGTFNFLIIWNIAPFLANVTVLGFINVIDLICIFLIIGAAGKSAQFGLHTWLPDAMEGPTPVSSLLHAATMVTAGVFLILRFSILFSLSKLAMSIVMLLGSLTIVFAGSVALVQYDLKKVIAYSTCSQLGYMFYACGLSAYEHALFHLFNHAFFKALLFLSAGSVIHSIVNEQDMRKFGALANFLPFTYVCFFFANLSLSGFPFLSGFYSKDLILEMGSIRDDFLGLFCYNLAVLGSILTVLYSMRSLVFTFLGIFNGSLGSLKFIHDVSFFSFVPMFFLFCLSIFSGFFFSDFFIGSNSVFSRYLTFFSFENFLNFEACFDLIGLKKNFVLFVIFFAFILADFLFIYNILSFCHYFLFYPIRGFIKVYTFLSKRWFFDIFYNKFFGFFILFKSYFFFFKIIDRGFLEVAGSRGLVTLFSSLLTFSSKFFGLSLNSFFFIFMFFCTFFLCLSFFSDMFLFLIFFLLFVYYVKVFVKYENVTV